MELLLYFLVALGINLVMFIPAFIFKTDRLTDASYAVTFIVLALYAFFVEEKTFASILLFSMIVAWSLRLGIFLLVRIWKIKKDKRFDGMRENFFGFLKFWILQGITVWIILIPSLLFFGMNEFFVFGFFVWLFGLTIETISDIQKYRFNSKNKNKFIESGLWKYSRHPNYFGEILCWVGIYIFAFPALSVYGKIFGLISPFFIIFLLLFVSGIPLLEKSTEKRWGKKYRDYQKKTSVLIPWFVKKNI